MYRQSAAIYDALYTSIKDYADEARRLAALIEVHRRSEGRALLDVACGTGLHLAALRTYYDPVMGLDLSTEMLEAARVRLPDVPLARGDMRDFDLGRRFDVVTCLFSSVGYMPTPADLNRAVANMARHLTPGGLLAVEAWLDPAIVRPDHLSASFVDEPDLKIARMSVTRLIDGRITQFDMHHLVATQQGVEHFVERHELTLFTDAEYCTAFAAAGLDMVRDDDGIFGRWLYLGVQGGDHE